MCDEIDAALVTGRSSLRELAGRYDISPSAVRRHRIAHLPAQLLRAKHVEETARANSLLDQVQALQGRASMILKRAEAAGDHRMALAALREMRGTIELLARLAIRNGAVIEVELVERYTNKVIDLLCELLSQEQAQTANDQLQHFLEAELAASNQARS